MYFILASANFSANNIGTLDQWTITRNLGTGLTYSGPSAVDKDAKLEATITLNPTYTVTSTKVTMGGSDITSNSNYWKGPSNNAYTLSIPAGSVTGNISITMQTSGGNSEEPETPVNPNPPSGDTTTPVGEDKVLLSNYRSETGTTLNSNSYKTEAKDTHVTFFDIPINPSEVYYVSWGVRAWFLTSNKTPIETINFYTASNAGKANYVKVPSNAAYMTICISSTQSGYSLPDAYIQQASIGFTATSSQLIKDIAGVSAMQDNKGLNSASYVVEDKDGSWVYEYIPVVAGQAYRIKGAARSWFLKSDKTSINSINLIQAAPQFTFIAPANTAYISVTFSGKQWTGEKTAVQLEEGTIDYNLK